MIIKIVCLLCCFLLCIYIQHFMTLFQIIINAHKSIFIEMALTLTVIAILEMLTTSIKRIYVDRVSIFTFNSPKTTYKNKTKNRNKS